MTNEMWCWDPAQCSSTLRSTIETPASGDNTKAKTQMERQRPEIETYAALVHGVMGLCYLITLPYHIRRKNPGRVVMHSAMLAYHIWAAKEHTK